HDVPISAYKTLPLHDALPISSVTNHQRQVEWDEYAVFTHTIARDQRLGECLATATTRRALIRQFLEPPLYSQQYLRGFGTLYTADRKSTRLNSSHVKISYAVF